MSATVPSVRIIKSFVFKGGTRLWSNRYSFTGGVPADATHWHTLMDAVVAAEAVALTSDVTIVEAIGYVAGSDVPVASKVYSTGGSLVTVSGAMVAPGECAALIRWSTAARSTKNHPIYCFSYIHGVSTHFSSNYSDLLDANQKSALETYAGDWLSGFSDGTHTCVRSSPQGHTVTGHNVEEYVTHRDFPYTRSL